ncbi:MAG: HAMP domain-containing sensor histidine kinase [Actinoplanes sp.]
MTATALERLRDLPARLALWVTLFSAVGLIVLSALLVRADGQKHEKIMDGELRRVTSTAQRLVGQDRTDALITAGAAADELANGCPEFAILPAPTDSFPAFRSKRECAAVSDETLNSLVVMAVAEGSVFTGYVRETDGGQARFGVEPFRRPNGQYAGAVVATMDPGDDLAAHRWVTLLVIAGGAVLLAAIGATSYQLAVRAVRPAAAALEQQEVLLADTAHDLRTPVAALRALAEAALANPAQRTELLPRTVDLARRMGTIIDGVLMRARLAAGVEPLALEPVWLDQLVTTVVEETPTGGARVTVTTAPSKVNADAALMQRAIGNLLDNAMRHGRIAGQPASVQVTVAGGRVIVADQGPGIDPSVARQTFDRFSSSGGSSGLGLAIVRWVAQAHGGTLRVYNQEGGGAIFEMELPSRD